MKKAVITIVLSVICIGNVSAQKWLKGIGKVLDKAEQVIQGDSKRTVTQNNKQSSGSNSQSNKADYTLEEVLHVDSSVVATPVDLGLSVQWASRNLGAAQPFQYGGYYDREADYISQYWGEGWRLPTEKEWEELFSKCKVKHVTAVLKGQEYMPDIAGYLLITGPNGNKMWLPAAGFKYKPTDESHHSGHGYEGFYWAFETGKDKAGSTVYSRIFFQHADEKFRYYPEMFSGWGGVSIRPVYIGREESRDNVPRNMVPVDAEGKEPQDKKEEPIRPVYIGKEKSRDNVPGNMVPVDAEGKEPQDKKEEPKINLPEISYVKLTKEFFKDAIKEVLARKATYTIIRRGVFFTNEKMQGNPLNHSYGLYKAMHDLGAFRIQEFDASKWVSNGSRMSEAAKAYSSYPMVGTKCIAITHMDKNLTRGLLKASYGSGVVLAEKNASKNRTSVAYDMNNIATYEFPNEFCELVNVSDMEAHQFQNGNIVVTLICDIVENPSDFKVALMKAYNKAYTPITGLTYDIPQSQKITMAFSFHFDAAKKKWSYKGVYKKNKKTNKYEIFYN